MKRVAAIALARVVVSPMAQYSATRGLPGVFHLVHLGARALVCGGFVVSYI